MVECLYFQNQVCLHPPPSGQDGHGSVNKMLLIGRQAYSPIRFVISSSEMILTSNQEVAQFILTRYEPNKTIVVGMESDEGEGFEYLFSLY